MNTILLNVLKLTTIHSFSNASLYNRKKALPMFCYYNAVNLEASTPYNMVSTPHFLPSSPANLAR